MDDPISLIAAGLDGLRDGLVANPSGNAILDDLAELEVQCRRLAAVRQELVAALDRSGVCADLGCKSTELVLSAKLRISFSDAKRRVVAARQFAPRQALTGEVLPPLFEHVAAAQVEGAIAPEHARTIGRFVDEVRHSHPDLAEPAEAEIVGYARTLDPSQLQSVARVLLAYYDPDGRQPCEEKIQRSRAFGVSLRGDGVGVPHGLLTPACTAKLLAALESLSKPVASDGTPDVRTPDQRQHDAFEALLTEKVSTTLVLIREPDGDTHTDQDVTLSTAEAERVTDEADLYGIDFSNSGGVLNVGRGSRTATKTQRIVLWARDRGCSFPGCTMPPARTEAHHVIPWSQGGQTNIDNLTLVCGWHHRYFDQLGYRCQMKDGVPYWTAPAWLEPDQIPKRNTAHRPMRT